MFLIDTNVFLHAANSASRDHPTAREFLEKTLHQRLPWATTWPILYEFLRVSTHARVFPKPLSAKQAVSFVEQITAMEEVSILAATGRHTGLLATTLAELSRPAGNFLHDVHTAVLMREHGVREIVTADTDFLQFGFLKVSNPFR